MSLRTSLLRNTAPTTRAAAVRGRRFVHHRVPLPYSLDSGLPEFLSPNALKTVAVDWQQGVLDRLNDLVRNTDAENLSVLQTLKQTATDPSKTLAFNYASEALNNSFFLSTLSPSPSEPSPNSSLAQRLTSTPSLGSLSALISHFSAHVSGLHPASGSYVWLVTDPNGNLGVVGTYAGGTVLVNERKQMGHGAYSSVDLKVLGEKIEAPTTPAASEAEESSAESPSTSGESKWQTIQQSASTSRPSNLLSSATPTPSSVFSTTLSSHNDPRSAVGRSLHPLLCVSTHQHCYLEDYGVWGRDEYVKQWWTKVDWKKVEDSFEAFTSRAGAVRR
ncbi:uncharacterized protein JCM6883_003802 [Sporobolomyces salmoneus]|uniref:uncharacterized protein n=1 Tax=Sporobolomyces salmoneus TaxID=183962 RepID=UPI00316E3568